MNRKVGRTLPYNEEAEKALLGAILLNVNALEAVSEILSATDFYHNGHKKLFSALVQYSEEKQLRTLDLLSIVDFLSSKKMLDECGGAAYISSLTEFVTNTSSALIHAKIIRQLSLRRQLIEISTKSITNAYDLSLEVNKSIEDSEIAISQLSQGSILEKKDPHIGGYLSAAMEAVEARMSGCESDSIETGFEMLDQMTDGGFRPTDFIIIAARPSIGKTAFATSIIQNMICHGGSSNEGYSVAFYSLEMSGIQVCQRLISNLSNVPLKTIRNANFGGNGDPNFSRMIDAATNLFERKLFIYDTPNMRLSEIKASARRLKREQKIQAIFIDYIGLIDSEIEANVPRFEQVAFVSRSLKALARELAIPVVVLCQVSREAEGDKNEPQLNNLRDSGAIEQDADMVMFLHRPRKIDPEKLVKDKDNKSDVQRTKVIIAKQRNGETGEFEVGFRAKTASFVEIANYTPS